MEGHGTLSRRTLRLAKAAAAISLASAPLVLFSAPVMASIVLARSAAPAPRYEWWLRSLHVAAAWRSANGAGVTVAVLSDGVSAHQSYLGDSVISGPDFTRSRRGNGSRYFGVTGTSLTSLIIGHGLAGGGRSISGVAPGARVLSIRVTLSPGDPLWSDSRITGRLPAAIAAGIRYAVDHGATVIDLPPDPGVRYPAIDSGSAAAAGPSAAEQAAVRYAVGKNVLLVAPAGDNGGTSNNVNYPAAYAGVLAVGAFGPNFVKSSYSSRQPYVVLTAAGQDVTVASRTGFRTMNSTNAASAIVAGIAALIRSEFPNLTAAQVRGSMTGSTVFKPKDGLASGSGYGTVDAVRAVAMAATMSPPHARPAMLGAVPRSRPVPPVMPNSKSVIARDLTGDAAISAAALVLLLIPITLYAAMARRRERRDVLLASERSQHAMGKAGHGSMLADPLLEFFGPQHARPAGPATTRSVAVPRFQPRPGLTGRSTMSSSLATRSPLPPPVASNGQRQPPARYTPSPDLPVPATDAPTSPVPVTPAAGDASPDSTVRRVEVSGSPPWEPAKEPTSELPWVVTAPQAAVQKGVNGDASAIPPPPDSVWDSAAGGTSARRSSAPRSLFEPVPAPLTAPQHSARPTGERQPAVDQPRRSAGGTGGSAPRANTAAGTGGSAPRANTAAGTGGSAPRAKTAGAGGSEGSPPGRQSGGSPPWADTAQWQEPPATGRERSRADNERGPVFVWNPTDEFPAVDQTGRVLPRRNPQRRRD